MTQSAWVSSVWEAQVAACPALAECRTVPDVIADRIRLHPDRFAISDGEVKLTYAELDARTNFVAGQLLAAGLTSGDRFAVLAPPDLPTVIAMLACARLGIGFCPLPTVFTEVELRQIFARLRPAAIYATNNFRSKIDNAGGSEIARLTPDIEHSADDCGAPWPGPEDPCWILWTSGSSAFPKPAVIPQRSAAGVGYRYAAAVGTTESDVLLNFLPLFHSGGLTTSVMHAFAAGACVRLMPQGFDPAEAIRIIDTEKVTVGNGLDIFWNRIVALPEAGKERFASLRAAMVGGNLAVYDVVKSLGAQVLMTAYASTEGKCVTTTPLSEEDLTTRKLGNGVPTYGTEVKIVDPETGIECAPDVPGEITYKGPLVFSGYLDDPGPGPFDEDGFFHSGDYGWRDVTGRLWWRGRYKQMVRTGGENVSCKEVEIALEDLCPEVVTAIVVGAPDAEWGETVVAFVQLRDGASLDVDSIKQRLRHNLAPFKVPKTVFQKGSADWPTTAGGKVLRAPLVEEATALTAESQPSPSPSPSRSSV